MADDPVAALERALGAPPPPGIASALGPEEIERLAGVIEQARRDEARKLRQASDSALKHVPFPLRIAVKKVLG